MTDINYFVTDINNFMSVGTLVNIDLLRAQRLPNMFAGRWALSRSNERSIKTYLTVGAAGNTNCTLIPFLTQPPHERTLTGQGSRLYPKGQGSRVRPGRGRRCARASPSRLALRARGSLYEFVL